MNVWLIVTVLFLVLLAGILIYIWITYPPTSYPSNPDARCGIITTVPLTASRFRLRNVNTTTELWWRYDQPTGVASFVIDQITATPITYDSRGQLLITDNEPSVWLQANGSSLDYTQTPTSPGAVWLFRNGQVLTSDGLYVLGIDVNMRPVLVNTNRATPTECGFRIATIPQDT